MIVPQVFGKTGRRIKILMLKQVHSEHFRLFRVFLGHFRLLARELTEICTCNKARLLILFIS